FGNPERMKRPRREAMAVLQQMLVVDREERSFQRREDGELVIGPFDRRERRANGFDLLAAVERLAANQQMRHPAGLERIDVLARHVFAEAHEPAEQDGYVPGLE